MSDATRRLVHIPTGQVATTPPAFTHGFHPEGKNPNIVKGVLCLDAASSRPGAT